MCKLLGVSRSGFYAWLGRGESPRAKANRELLADVRRIHKESRGTYGAPRIHAVLRKVKRVGRNRVARLLAKDGLSGQARRRFRVQTTDSNHGEPIAPNLLKEAGPPAEQNTVWVADITYVATDEGWLYLAAIMDLHSRKIVGWAMRDNMRAGLALGALDMALKPREPRAGLIHHSDRGSQYASQIYRSALRSKGLRASMSGKGNCYDNAAMESFFRSLKTELVYRTRYRTRREAQSEVFDWIEGFYNRTRLHSSLGYRSPADFEDAA